MQLWQYCVYYQLQVCSTFKLHGYTVHQIMLNTFYYQLTHTTLKKRRVIKTF